MKAIFSSVPPNIIGPSSRRDIVLEATKNPTENYNFIFICIKSFIALFHYFDSQFVDIHDCALHHISY